jgi:hypothetical protein
MSLERTTMSLLDVAALIVMLLLVLYVIDALRWRGRSARPLAREGGEPFHAFVRGRSLQSGANRSTSGAACPAADEGKPAGQQPLPPDRPVEMVRILNVSYAISGRRSG